MSADVFKNTTITVEVRATTQTDGLPLHSGEIITLPEEFLREFENYRANPRPGTPEREAATKSLFEHVGSLIDRAGNMIELSR